MLLAELENAMHTESGTHESQSVPSAHHQRGPKLYLVKDGEKYLDRDHRVLQPCWMYYWS